MGFYPYAGKCRSEKTGILAYFTQCKNKRQKCEKKHIKSCHPHHWLGYRDRIHLLIHCYHLKVFPQHFLEKLYLPIVFSQYHTSRFHYNLTL